MRDVDALPPLLRSLLDEERLAPLGPGVPNPRARAALAGVTLDDLFAPRQIVDRDAAAACLAGLWLYHDCLDEAHAVSQDLDTTEGSYWHAIMHRREPDPGNAAYWLRRVKAHPIAVDLARAAAELGYRNAEARWDALAFNEACAAHRGTGSAAEDQLRHVQHAEWELLFAYCYGRAVGA